MAISNVTTSTQFTVWKDITNAIITAIGDNATLSTTTKVSLVAAINELDGEIGSLSGLNTTIKTSIVNAMNEVVSELGDVASLDASFTAISNTVGALNNLVSRIGVLNTLTTTVKTNIVSALNEAITDYLAKIGDITTLTTTEQGSTVGAINELDAELGVLTNLATTAQGTFVDAINELDTGIGDLTTLTTTLKSSATVAINELNATKALPVQIQYKNLEVNHGRFATETTKAATTFNLSSAVLGAYNGAAITAGDKFINDNSNYGGAGGSLGTDIGPLMTKLDANGRVDKRFGFEFFIMDITAGASTADGVVVNAQTHYPVVTTGDAFLAGINDTIVWEGWVRVKSMVDGATFTGVVVGDANTTTYINGVEVPSETHILVSDGWVHLRQSTVLANEFKTFMPAIFATTGDVFQIALSSLYVGEYSNGLHLGVK